MNFLGIARLIGLFLIIFSAILLVPTLFAFVHDYYLFENGLFTRTFEPFFKTVIVTLFCGFALWLIGRNQEPKIFRREGILLVVLIWFIVPFFSALPFLLSNTLQNPIQAYFEMVSGYTTTGSTLLQAKKYEAISGQEVPYSKKIAGVLPKKVIWYGTVEPVRDAESGEIIFDGVEAVAPPLLFWRAMTQWLGGAGVVVLFIAILPMLGVGGKLLYETEAPGPIKEGMAPRVKETAIKLWKIYVVLTLLQVGLTLLITDKVPLFDAICIAFSTISTGGFAVTNIGLNAYQSTGFEMIVLLFMVLGATSFSLLYQLGRGRFYKLIQGEFILFISVLMALGLLTALFLVGKSGVDMEGNQMAPMGFIGSFRTSLFQIVSAVTTTGYSTVDFDLWPYFPQVVLLVAMFLGGMSGSTAGGIKMMRHLILFKITQYKVESIFSPRTVRLLTIEGKVVDETACLLSLIFLFIVVALSAFGTLFYVADGLDPETALGLVACMINNVGLSFRLAGPLDSCAALSDFSLMLSSLLMIGGRLEFFALLAILTPNFWTRR